MVRVRASSRGGYVNETCGHCRFFRVTREREDGRLGECRLQKVMGVFRDSAKACKSFAAAGGAEVSLAEALSPAPSVRRASAPEGPRVSANGLAAATGAVSAQSLKTLLAEALNGAACLREVELGRAWSAGELTLSPGSDDVKPKQLPLETHFHKLVMIRDNLRVMEQKINSHDQLQDAEKLDLHRRINRTYQAVARFGSAFVRPAVGEGPEGDLATHLDALFREVERDTLAAPMPSLGERWRGGQACWARDSESRTEPMEVFFHRLVVLRDRLLSLESQLSGHPHVAPDEADAMSAYLRRCHGSLTTFNVLFRDREDYFASAR